MNLFLDDYLLCYHDELFSINIGNNLSKDKQTKGRLGEGETRRWYVQI